MPGARKTGHAGGRTCRNGNGPQCARTIPRRGDPWNYFPHEHARSRVYRWGEDGLLGICDRQARLCFALALWNGKDPILKERLFGLGGPEGNHGEDVKELYYYLDATPTSSFLRALYKYPQAAFPYRRLLDESRRRSRFEPEFELTETGVFDGNRYFDVLAEYAKASPHDLLIRITVTNRGPEPALASPLAASSGFGTRGRGDARVKTMGTNRDFISSDARTIVLEHVSLGNQRFEVDPSRARSPADFHRERDQCRTPVRNTLSVALRERRISRLPDRRREGPDQSRARAGPKPRPTTRSRSVPWLRQW